MKKLRNEFSVKSIFKVWCLLLVALALNLFTGASSSASCPSPVSILLPYQGVL